MAKAITNLPPKFLQILSKIILSVPKRINDSIIITDNYKPTSPTDRSHFGEPNKFCFTIFGHLHNLL